MIRIRVRTRSFVPGSYQSTRNPFIHGMVDVGVVMKDQLLKKIEHQLTSVVINLKMYFNVETESKY